MVTTRNDHLELPNNLHRNYFWLWILGPDRKLTSCIKEAQSVNSCCFPYPYHSSRILKNDWSPLLGCFWELSDMFSVQVILKVLFVFAKESFVNILLWKLKNKTEKLNYSGWGRYKGQKPFIQILYVTLASSHVY